jgi:hypothetical protein
VLIVQSDAMNRSSVSTVMCASITSNLELEHAPGNFRLEKGVSNPVDDNTISIFHAMNARNSFIKMLGL